MNKFIKWWNKPCGVYIGCPMTGFCKEEMVKLSLKACNYARKLGLAPWSPVLAEGISGSGVLENKNTELDWKWPMDKEALNYLFVFLNLRADEKSFGCEDEYGRHRYSEWQPVVRISPRHASGYASIANYQTDIIAGDYKKGLLLIKRLYGKRHQRILWKLRLWFRSGPKWLRRQLRRLGQ